MGTHGYTTNLKLIKPEYNTDTWHDYEWDNLDTIDAVLGTITGIESFKGAWANNTAYAVGDIVTSGGVMYVVEIAHTTDSTSTFDDYWEEYPTYYQLWNGVTKAKEWATKTDDVVEDPEGDDYSSKAYAISEDLIDEGSAMEWAIKDEDEAIGDTAEYSAKHYATKAHNDYISMTTDTNVVAVGTNIANVNATGQSIANVNTVAGSISNVNTTAGSITNVNIVGNDISNVNAVGSDIANVDTVKNDLTNIDTVAGSISNVNNVGNDITNVNSVAGDLTNIDAVNSNKTNIDAVAGNATNINAVVANETNVNTVANNITNINTVKNDLTNIDNVANNKTNIDTCSTNITSITTAPTYASNANIWAEGTDAQVATLGGVHSSKGWAAQSAQAQVQANYNETDTTVKSYIWNKRVVSTMPTASSTLNGMIYQYEGTSNNSYTKGLFYECKQLSEKEVTGSQTDGGSNLGTITVNQSTFLAQLPDIGSYAFTCSTETDKHIDIQLDGESSSRVYTLYDSAEGLYTWTCDDSTLDRYTDTDEVTTSTAVYDDVTLGTPTADVVTAGTYSNLVWKYANVEVSLTTYGISFTGTSQSGNAITVVVAAGQYNWYNIDVIDNDNFVDLISTQTITGNKTFTGTVIVPTQTLTDNSQKSASTAFVKNNLALAVPTGTVLPFAGSVVPNGYLLCDGSAISRTDYADLFAVIGTAYGTGDGSTTFNIPNTVSRFLGYNGQGYLGETLPTHTHSGTTGGQSADHTHSGTTGNQSANHTHSRGSMDITGNVIIGHTAGTPSGVFTTSNTGSWNYGDYGASANNLSFKASRNWTGSTSGISANHTHSFTTGGVSSNHTHDFTTGAPSSSIYTTDGAVRPLTCRVNCIIKY